jgi:hypothetical protein
VVETALGAGRAATSTAPAHKAGKSIAGAFESLGKTLEKSGEVKPAGGSARTAPAASKKSAVAKSVTQSQVSPVIAEPKAEVSYEDPSGIQQGMDSVEVARRFGPPSLTLTTGPGEELLCYAKKGAALDVTMRNGKVAAVRRDDGSK